MIISGTALLIINLLLTYDLGLKVFDVIGIFMILSLYVITAVRPTYSQYLLIAAEVYSILELFLVAIGISYALFFSLLVITSLMTFLLLNKLMNIPIFLVSLITLALSIILTYYLYVLLGHVMATYVVVLGINTNYFTLMLSSSFSILILFLITLLLKKVIPALLHHEEK